MLAFFILSKYNFNLCFKCTKYGFGNVGMHDVHYVVYLQLGFANKKLQYSIFVYIPYILHVYWLWCSPPVIFKMCSYRVYNVFVR